MPILRCEARGEAGLPEQFAMFLIVSYESVSVPDTIPDPDRCLKKKKKNFKWDMNETSGRRELHGFKASFCVYSVAANPAGKGADFE